MVRLLKIIHLLPVAIFLWTRYLIPLLLLKQIRYVGKADDLVWEFVLTDDDTWYTKLWAKWAGYSGPFFFIRVSLERMKRRHPNHFEVALMRHLRITRTHELHHNKQQLKYGTFFYVLYGGHYLWIMLSNLWSKKKRSPYRDNFLEVEARQVAGEK